MIEEKRSMRIGEVTNSISTVERFDISADAHISGEEAVLQASKALEVAPPQPA